MCVAFYQNLKLLSFQVLKENRKGGAMNLDYLSKSFAKLISICNKIPAKITIRLFMELARPILKLVREGTS